MSSILDHATSAAATAAAAVDPYLPAGAKDAAKDAYGAAVTHGTAAVNYASDAYKAARVQAVELINSTTTQAQQTFTWAVTTTTTTITAYTPGPVKTLIQDTVAGAEAVRADPKAALTPYVPAYVIVTGERTYEIVTEKIHQTEETVSATTGYVVSKVNGTVEYVTSIPQVHSVIEQLNAIAAPVLDKIKGGSTVTAVEGEAEIYTISKVAAETA
ncbi:hypothetical protein HDU99_009582 [Rhizoclosmatium hyalinum]|nr:hypothetical protein HDU99_009582 [Rhizoclosmatium hyalinum]